MFESVNNMIGLTVSIAAFLGIMAEVVIIQQKSVDCVKIMNPEKTASVYDMKFQKKWLETCDEAEKIIVGKCAFKAFNIDVYKRQVVAGMGLLPVTTTFSKNKHRTRVQGITCIQSGMWEMLGQKKCKGYEIHMGESTISEDGANPFARIFNTVDKTEYMRCV